MTPPKFRERRFCGRPGAQHPPYGLGWGLRWWPKKLLGGGSVAGAKGRWQQLLAVISVAGRSQGGLHNDPSVMYRRCKAPVFFRITY